jgi:hypothetical protein
MVISSDFEVVDINDFDILLTDMRGEIIRNLEVDGAMHLSEVQASDNCNNNTWIGQ